MAVGGVTWPPGRAEGGRRGFVLRACCLIMVTYLWPNNTPRQISLVRFCYCCLVLGARDGFFFFGGGAGGEISNFRQMGTRARGILATYVYPNVTPRQINCEKSAT